MIVQVNTSANGVFSIDLEVMVAEGITGVTVVGLGNIGSKIADLLLRSGLPPAMLRLIDGDTVEAHNISNQLCGSTVDLPKVVGFKKNVIRSMGKATAEEIETHTFFLGIDSEDYPIQRQINLCENQILIFAIDNTECTKDIYNKILSKAVNIPLIIAGNFSRFLRATKGANATGAMTMLPTNAYYKSFFKAFYEGGRLHKDEEPSACRIPNASYAGSMVANMVVGRVINYLRFISDNLPTDVISSPEALAYAVGQNMSVNEDEEITTYPFEHSAVSLTINLHTGQQTPIVLYAGDDFDPIVDVVV